MFRLRFLATLCIGFSIVFAATLSQADTLELLNGEIIDGKFMGGTQNSIRFSVDGSLRTVRVADVLAVTFSGDLEPVELEPAEPAIRPEGRRRGRPPVIEPVEPVIAEPYVEPVILAPAGTPLLVRIVDGIDSREHQAGYRFAASLESDLLHDGALVAPRGTQLYGLLVSANQAGRMKGKTHLTLELTDIMLDGSLRPIVTGDYNLAGKKSSGKRSALKILGGAALGAIIDDNNRVEGAAIGAGVGAGASAITRGEQITVPSGTLIEFRLNAPLSM